MPDRTENSSNSGAETVSASWVFDVPTMSRGRYWHWRKTPWLSLMIPALGVLFMIPGIWLLFTRQSSHPLTAFLMLLGAYGIFRYWIVGIRFRRQIMKNPQFGNTLNMAFSETGFEGATENSEMKAEWTAVYETVTTPEGFLIYPQKEMYYWIPRSGFSSEEDVQMVAKLLEVNTQNKRKG